MVDQTRRGFVGRALAGVSTLMLTGCYDLSQKPWFTGILGKVEDLTSAAQHLFAGPHALAPEYTKADIAPSFRANGTLDPGTDDYHAHLANGFKNWRIAVKGLVEKPLSLSLEDIRALPSRTQITRHDCVEGWSCIGEWTGVKFGALMDMAGLKPGAKHIVLHCADTLGGAKYYETLDVFDVHHPQTILAYAMNGAPLTIPHGAPLRLRAERYLGYKQAKYVMRLEAVDSFAHIAGGQGGYWEDQGYDRYGGI
jgi:DMSO/TMAO reductase YedYZ molybdopterin-dependent catalytic subunit